LAHVFSLVLRSPHCSRSLQIARVQNEQRPFSRAFEILQKGHIVCHIPLLRGWDPRKTGPMMSKCPAGWNWTQRKTKKRNCGLWCLFLVSLTFSSTNQRLPMFELFFSSGHFPCFENVPTAACRCKQLAHGKCTGPAAELLKFCRKDTMSISLQLLRDWDQRDRPNDSECPEARIGPKKVKQNTLRSLNVFEHSL